MQIVYVGTMLRPDQPRVLMFAHDGRGLGHLRRLCRIAQAIQNDCAVLVVTGHRAASWLVPELCEFVHLPSHDSLDPNRSRHWGRVPFWSEGRTKGRLLRNAILQTVVDAFRPNLIMMDHLPMGVNGEMYEFIEYKRSATCYFLLRGVLDSPERANQLIFTEKGRYLLEQKYDRIFVMCDRRIADVAQEYGLSQTVAAKLIYAGYVAEPISSQVQERARSERGVGATDKWVVCSGGGGHLAEELIRQASRLVNQYPNVYFDLVLGPRSALPLSEFNGVERRVRIVKEDPLLPILHAASDIVICPGGYNSLMEVAVGRASVVVAPIRDDWEQREHARRLAKFLPVTLVEDSSLLTTTLERLLEHPTRLTQTPGLDLSGAARISQWILNDLSVAAPPDLMKDSSVRRQSKAKARARG